MEAFQFEVILFKARRSPKQQKKLLIIKRKGINSTKVIISLRRDEICSINNVGREANCTCLAVFFFNWSNESL